MDETGVMLSVLNSLKVLVSSYDLRKHRVVAVKRSLVTAVECISANGRSLNPLIIWPAATHRSLWTFYPTPGWHFACSQMGYINIEINLYWIREVFDPQTRVRAGGRPRILISDGFGTHESLELMEFCYEHRITLCRLPFYTSHKLQPCDVGVFGPLKSAYREQVEKLYRGGAGIVDKRHFTLLYDRARQQAITPRNIRSGWSKCGLFPFDPSRHVREDGLLEQDIEIVRPAATHDSHQYDEPIQTPVTAKGLASLRKVIEVSAYRLASPRWYYIQKLNNAAERVFAERTLLLEENQILFDQNNEKKRRQSKGSRVSGRAKVMSYEDIEEAQANRATREIKRGKEKRGRKHKNVPEEGDGFEPPRKPNLARKVDTPQLGTAPVARIY